MNLPRTAHSMLRRNARPVTRSRVAPLSLIASVVLAVVAVACTDVGTSPTTPVALAFETLPAPSIVYGDTLRDIEGRAAKLTAKAYNANGDEIVGADIEYGVEKGVTNGNTGFIDNVTEYLVATIDTLETKILIRAQINGIPSQTSRSLEIVRKPDSLDRGESSSGEDIPLTRPDTLTYASIDSVALLAGNLQVRVLHQPHPDSAARPVRAWPVRFKVVRPAGADSMLVTESRVRSTLDTTSDQGIAFRKIIVRQQPDLGTGVPDTVIVEATAGYRGVPLRGAPIRFTVVTRKTNSP